MNADSNLTIAQWEARLAPFKKPQLGRSLFQLANSSLSFVGLWWLMVQSLEVSYLLTCLLAVPAAFMMCRLFIIQHDCSHGAFFRSRTANQLVGTVVGVLTMTPFDYWKRTHAIHHGTSGDLDRRELGDIVTMTVGEYLALSRWRRFGYRLYRSSPVLFLIGPLYQFVLKHRFPFDTPRTWRREWRSVMVTNVGLALALWGMSALVGWKVLLLVHVPIVMVMVSLGVWLFYVQHQYEHTYWARHESWDRLAASLEGSSFYDLPRILHWATGYIGYHHIHHLSSLIPNYRLPECQASVPELAAVPKLSIRESFGTPRLKLWDEDDRRLISFRELRRKVAGGEPEQLAA
ncbi:MAG TPA: fatty acid desaturase [Thermoanaerobaculia bacterium]|nr:fatty acid desaturase [Thermoanaerobaculia bacterium]